MAIYLRAKGRTSPPAKIIGHRESINPTLAVLKLVAKYLVTKIYLRPEWTIDWANKFDHLRGAGAAVEHTKFLRRLSFLSFHT